MVLSRLLSRMRVAPIGPSYLLSTPNCRILTTQSKQPAEGTADSAESYIKECEKLAGTYTKYVDDILHRWKKAQETYFGKERDLVNYPHRELPLRPPPVRMKFIPDSFFQSFYPKTGVTGPYLFLAGTFSFLVSKELFVLETEFYEFLVRLSVLTVIIYYLGKPFSKYVQQSLMERMQTSYFEPLQAICNRVDTNIAAAQEAITSASAVPSLVKLKEENLALQLELFYRQRVKTVHQNVMRQLNYHVERNNIERNMQHRHLVQWVVDQVVKDITPAQEKEALTHCISELRRLAQVHKATV